MSPSLSAESRFLTFLQKNESIFTVYFARLYKSCSGKVCFLFIFFILFECESDVAPSSAHTCIFQHHRCFLLSLMDTTVCKDLQIYMLKENIVTYSIDLSNMSCINLRHLPYSNPICNDFNFHECDIFCSYEGKRHGNFQWPNEINGIVLPNVVMS